MNGSAVFGEPSRIYRYTLDRQWHDEKPHLAWCMLNPSTADEIRDDPTIRRCIQFSNLWGFGGLTIINIFALCSTDPAAIWRAIEPVGPDNNTFIQQVARQSEAVIAAWGVHGHFIDRALRVQNLLLETDRPVYVLKWTKDGYPGHPLYVSGSVTPRRWFGPAHPLLECH